MIENSCLQLMLMQTGLDHASSLQILDWLVQVQMTDQLDFGMLHRNHWLRALKITRVQLQVLDSIQMEHALLVEVPIRLLRFGILEVKDYFNIMMLILIR